ncbi:hypothetical protein P175DRAFT_0507518 [Aspergillus ochraceoroseus IBT 24754]|uniref:Uncharacterized protein n=1 Tax=Aspergillus ochraceoroseus IBT 24754 TaxID=1392256 RepID=A0A2T5M2E8_9EURO|nr:uncharacterized protein P175DRAFT_0507518 [Aspergillus ochraceoroseus IBT 24754]PTU22714.1 hypothetical protein P175DRAFT_0507518 [Aspergillus ochraceoroseus IBT 24754]
MEFRSRPTDFDARLIRRLVGTKPSASSSTSAISPSAAHPPGVSPPAASPPPASLTTASSATAPTTSFSGSPTPGIARSWIITEKLGERAVHLAQDDVDMGVGTPMTVGKFLCHLEEDPGQIAFMRIYYQIPTTGTEDADLATLAQQIQPPEVCGELEAYKQLMSQGSKKKQEEHDLVPGGYIKYLVWEKVPGLPLTEEFFWSLDPLVREDIRAKFRAAYEEMLRCGVKPQLSRISKIIYDQSTGTVRISGLRRGWPILDKIQWSDTRYVAYGLANRPDETDWRSHPEKWEL